MNRYCVTCIDGAPAAKCCGGKCMALTDTVEWLGTLAEVNGTEHAEQIILNLPAGEFIDFPKAGLRLWRHR